MAWKYIKNCGIALAIFAAITFGGGVGDIIYTAMFLCPKTEIDCLSTAPALIFTWTGSGVWASFLIFITGILAVVYYANPDKRRRSFLTMAFMSAVIFAPVTVVLNALEMYFVMTDTTAQTTGVVLYDPSQLTTAPVTDYFVKFILPLAVAALGLLEFFLAAALLIKACTLKPKISDEMIDEPMPAPRPNGQVKPGFGYYYPSRIYELPARTPTRPTSMAISPVDGRFLRSYYY